MRISFKCSKEEYQLVSKIVDRAVEIATAMDVEIDTKTLDMDIIACHLNGCRLELASLLAAPDFEFVHDVWGIMRHINRKSGQLESCFLPRCADHGGG